MCNVNINCSKLCGYVKKFPKLCGMGIYKSISLLDYGLATFSVKTNNTTVLSIHIFRTHFGKTLQAVHANELF